MYFLVIQYSSLVKQNVTYMNRNITIQHNHADKLREGQDMNKKENHSVKSEIEQALLRLMTQKSYLDITVTDIVQEAKVARVSFYRNFASISEVLDSTQRFPGAALHRCT